MEMLFFIIICVDVAVVGLITALLCNALLGNSPFARLIRLILSIGSGAAYFLLCAFLLYGDIDIGITIPLIVVLLPVTLLIIALVVYYMFKDTLNKKE